MSSTAFLAGRGLERLLLEDRIALDVGALPSLPGAAEPAQAVAHVEQEGIALLLAIVGDIDAGLDLLGDDAAQGGLALGFELGRRHRLSPRSAARRGA